MGKPPPWDHGLELRGTTPRALPLARLAQYLSEFARLLGADAKPTFGGIVRGSAMLRAVDHSGAPAATRTRLRLVAQDEAAAGRAAFDELAAMSSADQLRARVTDPAKATVIAFPPLGRQAPAADVIVHDTGTLDGVVVAVEGVDDTAHIRLVDKATGRSAKIKTRDMKLAQRAAGYFRGEVIRVRVHGTWRRDTAEGWVPHSVYADAIEDLDQADALSAMQALRAIPGNGWVAMPSAEAMALCDEIGGGG